MNERISRELVKELSVATKKDLVDWRMLHDGILDMNCYFCTFKNFEVKFKDFCWGEGGLSFDDIEFKKGESEYLYRGNLFLDILLWSMLTSRIKKSVARKVFPKPLRDVNRPSWYYQCGAYFFCVLRLPVTICHKIAGRNNKSSALTKETIENLEQKLMSCSEVVGAKEYAARGLKQFKEAQNKLNAVNQLLAEKLDAKELTYIRYIQAAKQVYLLIMDNLKFVTSLIRGAGSIDEKHIDETLKKFTEIQTLEETDKKEIEALNGSKKLRNDQMKKIKKLLSQNEEALNQMDQATAAIAGMPLDKGGALADFENAQKDLQDLVILRKRLNYA